MALKRYALLCMHFYPEMISTGMHMTELSTALVGPDLQIRVLCAQPAIENKLQEAVPDRMEFKGVEIRRVKATGSHRGSIIQRFRRGLSFTVNTYRELVRTRRDVQGVIVTTNPPFLGLVALLAQRLYRLPYVVIVYDVYPETAVRLGLIKPQSWGARAWSGVTKAILRNADQVVVIGQDMRDLIAAKLPPARHDRLTIIRNWSDDSLVNPIPRDKNPFATEHNLGDRFVVQYSGTMGRTHNIEPLLDAAEIMQNEPVLFQFIGDGAKRKALQEAAENRRLSNVQFLPFQPFENLPNVLSASDLSVVCLDSAFTGTSVPSKTYGVMAASRPILALMDPESEIGRTVQEFDCGWVIPNASGDSVAAAICTAMSDRSALVQKGANGRQAFLANFTLTAAADQYRRLLR